MNVKDIYKLLHPRAENRCFSRSHEIFTKINNILSHKTHLNQLKITESYNGFSEHNGIKVEIRRKDNWEIPKYVEIKQLLNKKKFQEQLKTPVGNKMKILILTNVLV